MVPKALSSILWGAFNLCTNSSKFLWDRFWMGTALFFKVLCYEIMERRKKAWPAIGVGKMWHIANDVLGQRCPRIIPSVETMITVFMVCVAMKWARFWFDTCIRCMQNARDRETNRTNTYDTLQDGSFYRFFWKFNQSLPRGWYEVPKSLVSINTKPLRGMRGDEVGKSSSHIGIHSTGVASSYVRMPCNLMHHQNASWIFQLEIFAKTATTKEEKAFSQLLKAENLEKFITTYSG